MEAIINNVRQAVDTLHNGTSMEGRREADKWLQDFRCSPEAWPIVLKLLEVLCCTTNDEALQFYAAHTLQYKVHRQWDTLPDKSSLVSVFPSLIVSYCGKPSFITNQMCIAYAAIGVRTVSDVWPDFFDRIFSFIRSQASIETKKIMIDTLALSIDELDSPMISNERRQAVKSIFTSIVGDVIQILMEILSNVTKPGKVLAGPATQDKSLTLSSLLCIEKWIVMGVTLRQLVSTNSLSVIWSYLDPNEPAVFSAASAVIQRVFQLNGTEAHNPKNQDGMYNPTLSDTMCTQILSLRTLYQESVKLEATEISEAIVELITEFGESNRALISRGRSFPFVNEYLQFLLACTSHPTKRIAEGCFAFWYMLSRTFKDTETYISLFQVILKGCAYPLDLEEDDDDEKEEVRSYRKQASPSLRAIFGVIGMDYLTLLSSLKPSSWIELEAIFFCLKTVGQLIDRSPANSRQISSFFFLDQSTAQHPLLLVSYYNLLEHYSGSLSDLPEIVPTILEAILSGVSSPVDIVRHEAATAMASFCADTTKQLVGSVSVIISTFKNVMNTIHTRDRISIVKGLVCVISQLGKEEVLQALHVIVEPILANLSQLCNTNIIDANGQPIGPDAIKNIREETILNIKCLKACLRGKYIYLAQDNSSQGSHPAVVVLSTGWETLSKLETKWSLPAFDPEHDVIAQLYKTYLVGLNQSEGTSHSDPLVEPIVSHLSQTFSVHHSHFPLNFCQALLAIYGGPSKRAQWDPILLRIIRFVTKVVVELSETPAVLIAHTQLLHSYFEFLQHALVFVPHLLAESTENGDMMLASCSVLIASKCFTVHSSIPPLRPMLLFLNDLLFNEKLSNSDFWKPVVPQILATNGEYFVSSLFRATIETHSSNQVVKHAELIWNLLKNYSSAVVAIISNTFLGSPFAQKFPDQQAVLNNLLSLPDLKQFTGVLRNFVALNNNLQTPENIFEIPSSTYKRY
eukprot:TRINITY_DN9155_c0_g1_i1.p1 TRINITY_DN9155_c0_g1~~TRINITY_DN9155_c0_g1_i1.p1  ORF type:complete len:970 (-),score=122.83 TRINITY_DN9155_c0_g1_i1:17-2926(-)